MFRRNRRQDAGQPGRDSGAEPGQDLGDELAGPDDELYEEPEDELDEYGDDLDELDDPEDELDEPADELDNPGDDAPAASRRSRRARRAAAPLADDLGDPQTWTRLRDPAAGDGTDLREAGPWDAAGGYPEAERIDFGSLLVPMREGFDIQVNLDEEAGIWIAVAYGDSALQLQAFAAPKRAGIWSEVRQEIVEEVAGAGGRSEERDGPFGPELLARLAPGAGAERGQPAQSLRFLGADGPRWFLRGLITGPAAHRNALARPFEEIFADVVVVRGEHAEPPRKALEIQLPEEARQAIEQQMEAEGMPSPFERGPEITEIH